MKRTPGIRRLHSASCPARDGGPCSCDRGYDAPVYNARARRKIRRVFPTLAAARGWQSDAHVGVRKGTIRAATPVTVREAAEELIEGMRSGAIRTRSGDRYKPSTIRAYDESLRLHVLDALGARRLADVHRRHVQRLADGLTAAGASASTVRNALLPLRVIYRRARRDDLVAVNPCEGLDLPSIRREPVRVLAPEEAAALVAALETPRDRALWATALYVGLRRGELMALRWEDVDVATGVIRIERAYDPKERAYVAPKSRAGRRRVPIAGALRDEFLDLRAGFDRDPDPGETIFGDGGPFDDEAVTARAKAAWAAAELDPVGLHEARHTAASLMIGAGLNVKALSEFLGHASITITLDLYGHLLPGSLAESATLLDAFLVRTGDGTGDALAISLQMENSRRS
jgi:integrase